MRSTTMDAAAVATGEDRPMEEGEVKIRKAFFGGVIDCLIGDKNRMIIALLLYRHLIYIYYLYLFICVLIDY